ncbi:hypothetical protein SO694_00005023 [Aureococcus anophagefferens]|uniref:Uncharacterized protein n=1 Tax=Aureococcus anophagefferens TaxID=44056 RepID=A0ABR1G9C3_AURAN
MRREAAFARAAGVAGVCPRAADRRRRARRSCENVCPRAAGAPRQCAHFRVRGRPAAARLDGNARPDDERPFGFVCKNGRRRWCAPAHERRCVACGARTRSPPPTAASRSLRRAPGFLGFRDALGARCRRSDAGALPHVADLALAGVSERGLRLAARLCPNLKTLGLARTLARLDVSDCASMFCVDFAAGLAALEVFEARGLGIAARGAPGPRDLARLRRVDVSRCAALAELPASLGDGAPALRAVDLDWRRAETGATPLLLLCQHAGQAACSVNPHQLADTLACVELLLEAGAALEPRTTTEHTNPRPVGDPSAEPCARSLRARIRACRGTGVSPSGLTALDFAYLSGDGDLVRALEDAAGLRYSARTHRRFPRPARYARRAGWLRLGYRVGSGALLPVWASRVLPFLVARTSRAPAPRLAAAAIRAARQATGPAELATEEISPRARGSATARRRSFFARRSAAAVRPSAQRQLGYWKGVASGLFPPGEGEGVVGGEIAERVPETRPVEVGDVRGAAFVAVVLVQSGDGALSARVVAERPHWTLSFHGAGAAATAACGGLFGARGAAPTRAGTPSAGRRPARTHFAGALYAAPAAPGDAAPPCEPPADWSDLWERSGGDVCAAFRGRGNAALRSRWYADLVVEFAANYLAFCVHARELEPPRAMQRAFGLAAPSRGRPRRPRRRAAPAWGAAFDRVASFLVFMFPDRLLKELFLSYATEAAAPPRPDSAGPAAAAPRARRARPRAPRTPPTRRARA